MQSIKDKRDENQVTDIGVEITKENARRQIEHMTIDQLLENYKWQVLGYCQLMNNMYEAPKRYEIYMSVIEDEIRSRLSKSLT